MATEFGTISWARGYTRRRLGLLLRRFRHRRVEFGRLCDIRRPVQFRVARNARTRFGVGCILDEGFTLENRGVIDVGDHTVFGHHCTIAADQSIVIGRRCLIGELVSIRDQITRFSSTVPIIDQGRDTSPIVIGDNVWIGAKATITTGVSIGSNTVIGAHAVVTGDVPANSVALGYCRPGHRTVGRSESPKELDEQCARSRRARSLVPPSALRSDSVSLRSVGPVRVR